VLSYPVTNVGAMTEPRFDPWLAVERRDDVILALHPVARLMGGGFHARRGGLGIIVIDPSLGGAERRAVLTHELVHHERGGAIERADAPTGWRSLVDREERAVDREVARRLVPTAELEALVAERSALDGGIDAADVAAHFDVPRWVAALALDRLACDAGDYNAGPPRWSWSAADDPVRPDRSSP